MSFRRCTQLFLIVMVSLFICNSCDETKQRDGKSNIPEHYLEAVLTQESLGNDRDAYDACMYLMVPMHYAFQENDEDAIQLFTTQFNLFVKNSSNFKDMNTMYKLSWMYLSSEYMKLMCSYDRQHDIPKGLYEVIDDEIIGFWNHYSGSYKAEFNGMEDLLQQVLYGHGYSIEKSYKYAICDVEQFILAIMCDISIIDDFFDCNNSEVHDKAIDWSKKMMQVKVAWQDDGGWLFGIGDMQDHQDYIYAGNAKIIDDMEPIKDPTIVDDVSHFSRMPLFLISYRDAQKSRDAYDYFDQLRSGLANQFKGHVLHLPDDDIPYVRVTNYMDGKNGVYRYSYHEVGVGYEAWDLSGCLLNGWYAFIKDSEVNKVFEIMYNEIPFDEAEKCFYTSGVTIREQNPTLTGWGGAIIEFFVQQIYMSSSLKSI